MGHCWVCGSAGRSSCLRLIRRPAGRSDGRSVLCARRAGFDQFQMLRRDPDASEDLRKSVWARLRPSRCTALSCRAVAALFSVRCSRRRPMGSAAIWTMAFLHRAAQAQTAGGCRAGYNRCYILARVVLPGTREDWLCTTKRHARAHRAALRELPSAGRLSHAFTSSRHAVLAAAGCRHAALGPVLSACGARCRALPAVGVRQWGRRSQSQDRSGHEARSHRRGAGYGVGHWPRERRKPQSGGVGAGRGPAQAMG